MVVHILEILVMFIPSVFVYLFHLHFNLGTIRLWLEFQEASYFEVRKTLIRRRPPILI